MPSLCYEALLAPTSANRGPSQRCKFNLGLISYKRRHPVKGRHLRANDTLHNCKRICQHRRLKMASTASLVIIFSILLIGMFSNQEVEGKSGDLRSFIKRGVCRNGCWGQFHQCETHPDIINTAAHIVCIRARRNCINQCNRSDVEVKRNTFEEEW
eukprot:Seg1550.5 transcript_id=Seg1550.5/GoldUCD/mRNA.D3Y31 product="hypothetical protein" protein_id=Seg1550.5/GoldUCD/D3Y31